MSVITGGICPHCKQEVGVEGSNIDPEDCTCAEDCVVLVSHNDQSGNPCAGSGKHTERLLE